MDLMADGGSRIQQTTQEVAQAVGEVAKDVKDAVGEMIEQGVQSVAGPTLTPQQIQQKQLEDQKKLAETRRKIKFIEKVDQEQKMVRQANKQKATDRLQSQQQKAQAKTVQKIQSQQAKKPIGLPEEVLRTQAEYKPGKGVGG